MGKTTVIFGADHPHWKKEATSSLTQGAHVALASVAIVFCAHFLTNEVFAAPASFFVVRRGFTCDVCFHGHRVFLAPPRQRRLTSRCPATIRRLVEAPTVMLAAPRKIDKVVPDPFVCRTREIAYMGEISWSLEQSDEQSGQTVANNAQSLLRERAYLIT